MPIYEYRCENGHTFEAFQSMADDALDECEVCGAKAQRILSAPAIHYKGSGFYTTDYARKGEEGRERRLRGGGGSDSGSKGSDSGSNSGSRRLGLEGLGSGRLQGQGLERLELGQLQLRASSGSGSGLRLRR